MNKVFVSGIGFASSIGTGSDQVAESLRQLRHGFTCKQLAGEGVGPELVCGTVEGFDVEGVEPRAWSFPGSDKIDPAFLRWMPPHGAYAVVALEEALAQAGLHREDLTDGNTGLYCASVGSPRILHHHLARIAKADWQCGSPLFVVSSVAGTLNFNLGAQYQITGANCGFVPACASSSHALGYAFDEIALGRQERMLVVGAEDGDAEIIIPFLGMRVLSPNQDPDTASRPFDCNRDGFVGTAGGAALILESERSVEQRGATPIAEFLGWGQASDGHSVAVPHPEGMGIKSAMELCLRSSGRDLASVDYINAHATSTPAGDKAEAIALKAIGCADPDIHTNISSTKGLTGHGLSYAGALEAAISVLCLQRGILPGNAALTDPDPACEGLNLPTRSEDRPLRTVMNNSSGFGGSNVTHLFGLT